MNKTLYFRISEKILFDFCFCMEKYIKRNWIRLS